MTRIGALNIAAALLALLAGVALALPERGSQASRSQRAPRLAADSALVMRSGRQGLLDAGGHFVPLADYRRIVSTSSVADSLLLALAEPDRVAAYTVYSREQSLFGYRYAGRPTVTDISKVEAIVALKPDLVLTNDIGTSRSRRLREVGVTVFDLGEMRGSATLLPNIVSVATLLGRREAGESLARRFSGRMHSLARHVPEAARPAGLYLAIHGDQFYGGTAGTSYHDVLTAAGIRDVAAARYRDWPRYTPEALLELDPELIVTGAGMARALCAHSGLRALRACRPGQGRVIELDGKLLGDPSLAMLDAAELLFEAVHASP